MTLKSKRAAVLSCLLAGSLPIGLLAESTPPNPKPPSRQAEKLPADLSTPKNAIKSLWTAAENGDGSTIAEALCAKTPEQAKIARQYAKAVAGHVKLRKAVIAKFGKEAAEAEELLKKYPFPALESPHPAPPTGGSQRIAAGTAAAVNMGAFQCTSVAY